MAQKRKQLTLNEKVEIINVCEKEKLGVRDMATRFAVGKTQISDILRNKTGIIKSWTENDNLAGKRTFPNTSGLKVDNLTFEWFCRARSNNIPVSGPLIREKVLQIAQELGFHDFKASGGRLDKFKIRKLPEICEGYEEKDIFNCDETGLFFRALPSKTMTLKGEKCTGGKISKERLTVLLCVNMIGEFEKPVIIGKAAKPRCFKGIDLSKLNEEWYSNRRAWMTREIMTEWLLAFDRRMGRQKRKVILFLDNATSHCNATLNNVKLVLLRPNTTSVCQALDQGIIHNFKVYYRQKVLRHILSRMDNVKSADELAKCISVLDAILWISSALKQVSSTTVSNCFKKAGFVCKNDRSLVIDDNVEELEIIEHELNDLLEAFGGSEDYATLDDALYTENMSTDISELIADLHEEMPVCSDEDESEQQDDDNAEPDYPPLTSKLADEEVGKLKHYFMNKKDEEGFNLISEL